MPPFVAVRVCHGSITRTRITRRKVNSYIGDLVCRWRIVKKLRYFEVILNIFKFSRV